MPIIETDALEDNLWGKPVQQIYNGLDCLLTFEVFEELRTLHNEDPLLYNFERALQAPALDMMQRGFAVDELERRSAIADVTRRIERLDSVLQRMAYAVWDKPLNPRSHKQLLSFFYTAMKLPEVWTSQKGVRKLSMNNESLEKLEVYFHARPIIACIQGIREWKKVLEVLQTQVRDGRMYYSINIAGTESGRFSSSASAFGDGLNIQNLKKDPDSVEDESDFISIRRLFISDPGKKLCGIDLEQAESREVGWLLGTLFDDWRYLEACYGGDLHTYTCKLIWPKLEWPGTPKGDRAVAEQKFYRHFSYRDMSKKGGHLTNYLGSAFTAARHLKVPKQLMDDFQAAYFKAFPLPRWHRWVAQQLQTTQQLTTPFGRERHFFGRPNDDTTLREAVAYVPQSATADRMNLALWRIWKHLPQVELLAQVHDAVYFQYPPHLEATIIPAALALIDTPITHLTPSGSTRTLHVPGEAKIGWNWGNYNEKLNPDGLRKWKPGEPDTRVRRTGLQRVL